MYSNTITGQLQPCFVLRRRAAIFVFRGNAPGFMLASRSCTSGILISARNSRCVRRRLAPISVCALQGEGAASGFTPQAAGLNNISGTASNETHIMQLQKPCGVDTFDAAIIDGTNLLLLSRADIGFGVSHTKAFTTWLKTVQQLTSCQQLYVVFDNKHGGRSTPPVPDIRRAFAPDYLGNRHAKMQQKQQQRSRSNWASSRGSGTRGVGSQRPAAGDGCVLPSPPPPLHDTLALRRACEVLMDRPPPHLVPFARAVRQLGGLVLYGLPGYEADDLVASLAAGLLGEDGAAAAATAAGADGWRYCRVRGRIAVISADSDMLQLLASAHGDDHLHHHRPQPLPSTETENPQHCQGGPDPDPERQQLGQQQPGQPQAWDLLPPHYHQRPRRGPCRTGRVAWLELVKLSTAASPQGAVGHLAVRTRSLLPPSEWESALTSTSGALLRLHEAAAAAAAAKAGGGAAAAAAKDDGLMAATAAAAGKSAGMPRHAPSSPLLSPAAHADYLALVGKPEAGVSGAGVGARAARKLLARYGSVEGVVRAYERGELDGSLRPAMPRRGGTPAAAPAAAADEHQHQDLGRPPTATAAGGLLNAIEGQAAAATAAANPTGGDASGGGSDADAYPAAVRQVLRNIQATRMRVDPASVPWDRVQKYQGECSQRYKQQQRQQPQQRGRQPPLPQQQQKEGMQSVATGPGPGSLHAPALGALFLPLGSFLHPHDHLHALSAANFTSALTEALRRRGLNCRTFVVDEHGLLTDIMVSPAAAAALPPAAVGGEALGWEGAAPPAGLRGGESAGRRVPSAAPAAPLSAGALAATADSLVSFFGQRQQQPRRPRPTGLMAIGVGAHDDNNDDGNGGDVGPAAAAAAAAEGGAFEDSSLPAAPPPPWIYVLSPWDFRYEPPNGKAAAATAAGKDPTAQQQQQLLKFAWELLELVGRRPSLVHMPRALQAVLKPTSAWRLKRLQRSAAAAGTQVAVIPFYELLLLLSPPPAGAPAAGASFVEDGGSRGGDWPLS